MHFTQPSRPCMASHRITISCQLITLYSTAQPTVALQHHLHSTMSYEPEIKIDFAAEAVPLTPAIQNEVDPLGTGFVWYTPPLASAKSHSTGGHEWCISGHDMQVLTTTVPAGESVITEVGSFMFGSADTQTEVECTLCGRLGCSQGCSRICGGESCIKVILTNMGSQTGFVGLTPTYPAKIIPVQVSTNGAMICAMIEVLTMSMTGCMALVD
jgi:Mitochondrial biogenesis AIM24